MPAKSPDQLAAAYSAASKGEEWGKKMVSDTPEELKKRFMTGRKRKKSKKGHKRARSKK